MYFTQTGYCTRWGKARYAREVSGLSKEDKARIADGLPVYLADCPPDNQGQTIRRVIKIGAKWYTRTVAFLEPWT